MRPRPFGRGRARSRVAHCIATSASMRPRPFGRGRRVVGRPRPHDPLASMRPRPFGRGRVAQVDRVVPGQERFNEAAPVRARQGGRVATVLTLYGWASMRPRPFGRGRRSGLAGGDEGELASMRPRSIERGRMNRLNRISDVPLRDGFNEAALDSSAGRAAMVRRGRGSRIRGASMRPRARFERGRQAGQKLIGKIREFQASMRPRSIRARKAITDPYDETPSALIALQ